MAVLPLWGRSPVQVAVLCVELLLVIVVSSATTPPRECCSVAQFSSLLHLKGGGSSGPVPSDQGVEGTAGGGGDEDGPTDQEDDDDGDDDPMEVEDEGTGEVLSGSTTTSSSGSETGTQEVPGEDVNEGEEEGGDEEDQDEEGAEDQEEKEDGVAGKKEEDEDGTDGEAEDQEDEAAGDEKEVEAAEGGLEADRGVDMGEEDAGKEEKEEGNEEDLEAAGTGGQGGASVTATDAVEKEQGSASTRGDVEGSAGRDGVEGSEEGVAADDAGKKKRKKKHKKRKKREPVDGKEKEKAFKGPPPRSRVEMALISTPLGRMLLTLLLIMKELLRAFVPQLYFPVSYLCTYLEEEHGLLSHAGLAVDMEAHERQIVRQRLVSRGLQVEDEVDETDAELAEEQLLPAPVDRYKRVSAGFLARQGLVEEGEDEAEYNRKSPFAEEDGEDGRSRGPSFGVTLTMGSRVKQGAGTVGVSKPRTFEALRDRRDAKQELAGLKDKIRRRASSGKEYSKRSSWMQGESLFGESLTGSLSSLTSKLSKVVKGKSKKDKYVEEEEEEEDEEEEEEGEWVTKLPPRRALTPEGPKVLGKGKGAQEGRKATLSLIEKEVLDEDDDEEEEEEEAGWASRSRRTTGQLQGRTDLAALARKRKGRSLFGDDDDDVEDGEDEEGEEAGRGSKGAERDGQKPQRFVRRVEDISGGGRIFAGLGFSSSASDKSQEAKRRSSLDFSGKVRSSSSGRQPPTSASFSSSRDDSDDEWDRRPSSVGKSSAAQGRSSASPRQEIEEIRRRTRDAFSGNRKDSQSSFSRGK